MTPEFFEAIEVVAGVLEDDLGRILLARRPEGRDLAGAWEFPGGKREPGETPAQALGRELHEELGVRIQQSEPLISVPQAYPDKRIVLDVHRVQRYSGIPRGRENQALAWVPMKELSGHAMPPADRPVIAALNEPAQYLITPEPSQVPGRFLAQLEAALVGGLRLVQLRAKQMLGRSAQELAAEALRLCRQYQACLLVNGQTQIALDLGMGLHLTCDQLMATTARPLPAGQKVAASCHTLAELRQAEAIGLDFVVLGPVSATLTHPDHMGLGWTEFARLREQVSIPIYAIGGMTAADVEMARRHGAQGIAAITSLWPSQALPDN